MLNNLTFGCGRLTGGLSCRESFALLDCCLSGGVTRFDVAPSYGIGTAEDVLGRYLARIDAKRTSCQVVGKVGSSRPAFANAKILGRAIKRRFVVQRSEVDSWIMPSDGPICQHSGMDFSTDSMDTSLRRTLDLLRVDSLDSLLLHEVGLGDVSNEVVKWLDSRLQDGQALSVGYSTGAQFSYDFDENLPSHWIAQTAPRSDWFTTLSVKPIDRPLSIHSINKTFSIYLRERDLTKAVIANVASAFSGVIDKEDVIPLMALVLLNKAFPHAYLIVSTSSVERLNRLLKSVCWLDGAAGRTQDLIMAYREAVAA